MLESGNNPNILNNPNVRVDFRRSMYIVGLMLRFFDFKNREVRGDKLHVSEELILFFMFSEKNLYDKLIFITGKHL